MSSTTLHPVHTRNGIVAGTSQYRQPVRLIFGGLYLAAGIVKFFHGIEDVGVVLHEAERANAGSWLADPGAWLVSYSAVVRPMIGALFIGWNICLLTGRYLRTAVWGQLPVLATFILLLAAARPQIVLIDAPFLAAALFLLRSDRGGP